MAVIKTQRRVLLDRFAASLPPLPGLERRMMFGCPVATVNGHMCAGLFRNTAFVRLPPSLRRAFADQDEVQPFEPFSGRPLLAYVTLPDAIVEDEVVFAGLLAAACAFTAALPPKARRRPRKVRSGSPRS